VVNSKKEKMKNKILAFIFIIYSIPNYSQSFDFKMNLLGGAKEKTASLSSGDIDNDGDIDIIVANGRHWPGQNKILINNGIGGFTVEKNLGSERLTSYAAELSDFDNDGDLDIAVGNDKAPNYIFINDGRGNFIKSSEFGEPNSNTRNITLNDIDNDGDIDILITNRRESNEICLNDGLGNFSESILFGTAEDSTIDVEVSDMNMDGHKDLILANRDSQPNYVYFNDGI
jgi:hypothetical protein